MPQGYSDGSVRGTSATNMVDVWFLETKRLLTELPAPRRDHRNGAPHRSMQRHDVRLAFP